MKSQGHGHKYTHFHVLHSEEVCKKKVIVILNVSVSITPGYLKASPGSILHFI